MLTVHTVHITIWFVQAFTIMDQNRDGFIDKNDLRDTFAALGETTCVSVHMNMSLLCCEGFILSYCIYNKSTQMWNLLVLKQLVDW